MSIHAPEPVASPADPTADAERSRQVRQAEDLLFSGPRRSGFAKSLFQGAYDAEALGKHPTLVGSERDEVEAAVEAVGRFAREQIDPAAIDREADIPPQVVEGLAGLGVLGMNAPRSFGGRGFSQVGYGRVMEVIGGRCASTAVFVNAHHSIGIRALMLFGTEAQKARWLPPLARGEMLGAFALTEAEAGSDAANVQTTATPSADGRTFILEGSKRYITNGGIAGMLTVMARTPDPKGGESKVSAFLVTPDMPGFEVVEARMPKCGIRGTATARLAFHAMPVPAENLLGPLGKGLRVALTVLDYGRTTFGACCAGMARTCLEAATRHAARRRQFGRPLADLELIKKKIAFLAASAYAIEATARQTAALIDRGSEDVMLETAMLKVYSTDALWQASYETLQVHGGQGYFCDEPYERLMRDARINTIGEGANEVLKSFIALVGMRDVGEGLKATLDGLKRPTRTIPTLWRFGGEHLARRWRINDVPTVSTTFHPQARELTRRVRRFGRAVERTLIRHREGILEMQYVHERVADAAIALYVASCTLARLDAETSAGSASPLDREAGLLAIRTAFETVDRSLRSMSGPLDALTTRAADSALAALTENGTAIH